MPEDIRPSDFIAASLPTSVRLLHAKEWLDDLTTLGLVLDVQHHGQNYSMVLLEVILPDGRLALTQWCDMSRFEVVCKRT